VGFYHAGRTKLARERAQAAFEAGRTRVLVATNAFGMGIDLPDIRLLVHFQTPGSLEAYYQEAGRAGRDGAPARCVLFFGAADLVTQRRLASADAGVFLARRREEALRAMEAYAVGASCRQAMLTERFAPDALAPPCGGCDVCRGEVEGEPAERAARPAPTPLPDAARDTIVRAVGRLTRPVGKQNLARALRGSRAKTLSRGGLLQMPEYGALAERSEAEIVAAIDALLAEGRLRRAGRKYPTLWLPGKPIRGAGGADADAAEGGGRARPPKRSSRYGGPVARALDSYRRRQARALKWKAYMVFQRRAMLAIDREEPTTREALARIPGLGPAKIERFGDDILALVRQHGSRSQS